MLTDEQLADMRERWANRGPWFAVPCPYDETAYGAIFAEYDEAYSNPGAEVRCKAKHLDAIAAAPADVAALLAEVERLKADLKSERARSWDLAENLRKLLDHPFENLVRGTPKITREQALHLAGATDYDTLRARLAVAALTAEVYRQRSAHAETNSERLEGETPCLPDDDRPIWERIAELAANLPDEGVAGLPVDGATEHDHYLYGAPPRAEIAPRDEEECPTCES